MQKSVDGVVMDCTPEEIAEAEALALVYEAEKAITDARITRDVGRVAPILVGGNTFDADTISQDNIRAAIEEFDVLAPSGTIQWTLADNTIVPVTIEDLKAVKTAIVVRYAQLHAAYVEYKQQQS